MSAVAVTYKHVDAVLRFALPAGHHTTTIHIDSGEPPTPRTLTLNTASCWGEILLKANRRNLQHLYPATSTEQWGFPPGDYELQVSVVLRPALGPVAVLKACQGLAYQCSDHPDWEKSIAYRILEAIKAKAILCLPGYDEAAWTL